MPIPSPRDLRDVELEQLRPEVVQLRQEVSDLRALRDRVQAALRPTGGATT